MPNIKDPCRDIYTQARQFYDANGLSGKEADTDIDNLLLNGEHADKTEVLTKTITDNNTTVAFTQRAIARIEAEELPDKFQAIKGILVEGQYKQDTIGLSAESSIKTEAALLARDLDILSEDASFRGPLGTKIDAIESEEISNAILREMYGESGGNEYAKRVVGGYTRDDGSVVKGLKQVAEERRERLKNLGVTRSGVRFGANTHRFKKAVEKDETALRKLLDEHTEEGETIVDIYKKAGNFLFDSNTITPKNADSYLELNTMFGDSNATTAILNGLRKDAGTLGIREVTGPNPERFVDTMAKHYNVEPQRKAELQRLMRGAGEGIISPSGIQNNYVGFLRQTRRALGNALLGRAFLYTLADKTTTEFMLKQWGFDSSYLAGMGRFAKIISTQEERNTANFLAVDAVEMMQRVTQQASKGRFVADESVEGNRFIGMYSSVNESVARLLGIGSMTRANTQQAATRFLRNLGQLVEEDKRWSDLHNATRSHLQRAGVREQDWHALNTSFIEDSGGGVMALNPQRIDNIHLQRLFTGTALEFADTAALKPNVVDDLIMSKLGVEKGTYRYELVSPLLMFMQFPVAFGRKIMMGEAVHINREMGELYKSAMFAGAWMATSTLTGYLSMLARAGDDVLFEDRKSIDEWDDIDFRDFNSSWGGRLVSDMAQTVPLPGSSSEAYMNWGYKSLSMGLGSAAVVDWILRLTQVDQELQDRLGLRTYRQGAHAFLGPFFSFGAEGIEDMFSAGDQLMEGDPIQAASELAYGVTGLAPFRTTPLVGGAINVLRRTLKDEDR